MSTAIQDAIVERARRVKENRRVIRRETDDIIYWAENNFYTEATFDRPVGVIRPEPHQKAILRYAFKKEGTYFPFQTIIYSTIKKGGKTAVGGLVGRWAAECWGDNGDVYFVGNDANQAKEKGYAALKTSIELHPDFNRSKGVLRDRWLLRETDARYLVNGSKIHAVATDYKGEAGANPILTVWTEIWGITDKAGKRFWAEMAPSPTRPNSLRFIETYAGFTGESDILENLYESIINKGRQLTVQDLMDELGDDYENGCFEEAPDPESLVPCWVNESARMFAYWDTGEAARRMPWQKGEHGARYYASEAATQTEAMMRRIHYNEWISAESEFVPIELWDACLNPLPLQPNEKTPLLVALDAAVSGDCFGLVVVSRDPDNPTEGVAIRAARKWDPPPKGKIDFDEPGEVLRWLKDNFNVVQVAYDPHQLHYFVKKYREDLGLWFESYDQGDRRLVSDKQLYDLIVNKRIRHDGNADLRIHIQNCNAKIPKDQDNKLRLVKKSETRKIDLAVALSMASAECLRLTLS